MKRIPVLFLAWACLALAACQKPVAAPPRSAAGPVESGEPQAKLPTLKLWLGAHEMVTELALTTEQHRMGMMWRTNMGAMEGMIFVFGEPDRRSFWMKNTLVPLDAAYLAADGTILEVHPLHPKNEVAVESESDRVQFVLETPQGWFQRNNVKPGMVVRTEKGTLQETFLRRK